VPSILRHTFLPADNRRLAHLCGPLDGHLRVVESALSVHIARRNEAFRIEGERPAVQRALGLLESLYEASSEPLDPQEVRLALARFTAPREEARERATRRDPRGLPGLGTDDEAGADTPPETEPSVQSRRGEVTGRTPNQATYLRHILTHDITFGVGPAGTGKTYLAVAAAVDALERSAVQRIVLTRPAVEAGERLGFLPGDLSQKVDPYLRPLYDALYDLMGADRVAKAFEKNLLEVAPLAFMRGRTLNHAFVILDEAQNTTPEQMKMFLTRIGFGTRAVVTGDVSQIDLPRGTRSGLVDAGRVLRDVRGIAMSHFTAADVVRHPLVARIVDAYDNAGAGPSREHRLTPRRSE
jgi:phosphate starvation-inducible protein PhoH and related proteins